jgi:hypothetical protein
MLLAAVVAPATARDHGVEEYQLKAAVIFNLAKFVEWPPETLKGPADPITICLIGESPIAGPLQQAVGGKMLAERHFMFKQLPDARQGVGCQILFFSSSAGRGRWRPLLADIRASGVLTVGEADRFAQEGGMVNLKTDGERIQLEVNLQAAEQGHVWISSKLLNLAEIVKK